MNGLAGTALCVLLAQSAVAITPSEIVRLANQERKRPLTLDPQLTLAAERKLDDMLAGRYFAHTHGSRTPWAFIEAAGYDFASAAENLGRGFETAEQAHRAWMKSKGHRRNILGDFTDVGVAVKGDLIVVMFGRRRHPER